MERNIQKHWQKEVTKIVKARKRREVTQERLATMAGISTQTLSRFEQAKEDIQLSTVLKILEMFSMQLKVDNSYYFKVFIYKVLVDAIKNNPKVIKEYSFPKDDNEDQNEIYQFLRTIAEEIQNYDDKPMDCPLILSWKDFQQFF